jgi:cation diffusion facilitator family transporter
MNQRDRYRYAKIVTIIGALVNMFLGIIKLAGGYLFHSHALVADGIHSFSDLLTDVTVLFASKYGSLDADDSHPYGHQRIETAATLLLSVLLIVTGSAIAWDSIDELMNANTSRPEWLTLPIICASIVANEILYQYTQYMGNRIQSQLLIANAWHHRSDAASSLVVLIGLIGSVTGYIYLDAVAAIIVGIMIIKMGGDYAWNSVKELVDTGVEPELLIQINNIIQNTDGVRKIHQLRSRSMGGDILIDVHVLVHPKISVSEGHYIAQHVHQSLTSQIDRIQDVTIHVDPEDDETSSPSMHLPSRSVLKDLLFNQILMDFPQILFWDLHYLDGKISIDIICRETFTQWSELHKKVVLALNLQKDIHEIRLFSIHDIVRH